MKKIRVIKSFYGKKILAYTDIFYVYAKTERKAINNILQKEITRYPYDDKYDTVETTCIGINDKIGIPTFYTICKTVTTANTIEIEWYKNI